MYPNSDQNLNYETDDAVYWFTSALDPLNHWSAHAITIWNEHFPTAEHAYHYRKFSDTEPELAKEIQHAPSPWAAYQLAKEHKAKERPDWDDVRVEIMTEILQAKAQQNADVADCLRSTGSKQIIENSPWDDFWGCGPNGDGQNMSGKILMQIRDELNK
jgi:ribA/ribD-fused uncharacterized protein